MGWPFALGILVAGLLIGQLWARRSRRLWGLGSARPGLALLALVALLAALVTGVRGLWPEALVLLLISAGATAVSRGRAFSGASKSSAEMIEPQMSRAEAAALLGVSLDAAPETVRAAHRRLIRMGHPDQGGTAGLAAQLNAARDVLLSGSRERS